jgi:tyrosyl-tRNA synthetase
MEVKKQLARELTTRFHNAAEALAAEENFAKVFSRGGLPDEIPEVRLPAGEPLPLANLLVATKLVGSTSEGRRMVTQGAVSVDGVKIDDLNGRVVAEGEILIKVGKRRFCRVFFTR